MYTLSLTLTLISNMLDVIVAWLIDHNQVGILSNTKWDFQLHLLIIRGNNRHHPPQHGEELHAHAHADYKRPSWVALNFLITSNTCNF